MKLLKKNAKKSYIVTLKASQATKGRQGGAIMEGTNFVWKPGIAR